MSTATPTVSYATPEQQVPFYKRINYRLVIFLVVASAPFLFVIGQAIRNASNGGIVDHGDYKSVDLKQLGNFPFDPEVGTLENVPPTARALDGQRVKMQGFAYMRSSAGAKGKEFEFVYDVNKCCFNGPPLVQERVFAFSKDDIPVPPSSVFAELTGILRVRITRAEGNTGPIVRLFDLDIESIKAVQ